MEYPVKDWNICFHADWCFVCNCQQEMKKIPNIKKVFSKSCVRCDTIYNYDWDWCAQNSIVYLPDNFNLPSQEQLNQMTKTFN